MQQCSYSELMRSMSSTNLTVINFGILGLLRRLHHLNIQFSLETRSEHTGISYPNMQAHKAKAKQHDSISKYNALNLKGQCVGIVYPREAV